MRIIRKYKNRKLYDTEEHRYINLATLVSYVDRTLEFQVLDTESNDVTKDILSMCVVHVSCSIDQDKITNLIFNRVRNPVLEVVSGQQENNKEL